MKKILYNYLQQNGISIDQDVFYYGISLFKNYILFFIITIPFIIHYSLYYQMITFFIFYIPLRRYLGGFHFNQSNICIFASSFVSIIICLSSKYYNIQYINYLYSFITLLFLTIYHAPVDHKNKRLTLNEKNVYKNKAIIIEIFFFIFSIIAYFILKNFIIIIMYYINLLNILNLILGKYFSKNS